MHITCVLAQKMIAAMYVFYNDVSMPSIIVSWIMVHTIYTVT